MLEKIRRENCRVQLESSEVKGQWYYLGLGQL